MECTRNADKLNSGSWRVQVRRKREYVANTFIRRRDAEEWAIEVERSIDRGIPIRRSRPLEPDWPLLELIIQEEAKADNVAANIEAVLWTGKNRVTARRAAAQLIANKVEAVSFQRPSDRIFLIGHSHGGSAVAHLIKEFPPQAKLVCGCAFLSTPFVAARPRPDLRRFIQFFISATFFAMLALWLHMFPVIQPNPIGTVTVLIIAITFLVAMHYVPSEDKLRAKASEASCQQTADLPDGRYLFLRSSGDEAAAVLSTVQLMAWLTQKAYEVYLKMVILPQQRLRNRAIFASIMMVLVLTHLVAMIFFDAPSFVSDPIDYFRQLRDTSFWELLPTAIFSFFLLYAPLMYAFFSLAALMLVLLQSATTFAFGWTPFASGLLVELAIKPLPYGAHTLWHVGWGARLKREGLAHSQTYNHPEALSALKNWLRFGLQ